jgi:hypothetical protein
VKRPALALAFALLAAAGAAFVAFGRFNIDEGMHLNAGRLIYERGWLPYRDFPFSQGPGGPFLYGAAGAAFGSSLWVGRGLSLALNLVGIGALAAVAARFAGRRGALGVVLLTGVNFPALWCVTQVRTEPPAIALSGLALLAWLERGDSAWRRALSPSLLVWATAVRLTYAVPLLALCALVAWELRRAPRRLLAVGAILGVQGLVASAPLWAFPEQSFFHVVSSQLGRDERLGWSDFSLGARFWYFARWDAGFQPLLIASALPALLLVRRWRAGWRPRLSRSGEDPVLAVALSCAGAALVFAPLLVFRMGFFQYFVHASLLLTTAIAIAAPALARGGRSRAVATWGLVGLCGVASAALGLAHLETWLDTRAPVPGRLAPLRARVERLAPQGCTMLTFETHVAVEIGCDVPSGLEYSYFSFFPRLDPERARAHGVLDRQLLAQRLREDPPELVALTRSGVRRMTGRPAPPDRPPRHPAMGRRYRLLETLELPVGPIHTFWEEVFVYLRRDLAAPGDPGDGYSM